MALDPLVLSRLQEVSGEERNEAEKLIPLIVELAEHSRREGLLALEERISNMKERFLAYALELVVDGNDPVAILDILLTAAFTGRGGSGVLLKKLIIITGVLAIQSGDNPRIVEQKMAAFLGAEELVSRWEGARGA